MKHAATIGGSPREKSHTIEHDLGEDVLVALYDANGREVDHHDYRLRVFDGRIEVRLRSEPGTQRFRIVIVG